MLLYNKQQSRDLIHDQGTETLLENKIDKAYAITKLLPSPQFRQSLPQSFRSIAMLWETD